MEKIKDSILVFCNRGSLKKPKRWPRFKSHFKSPFLPPFSKGDYDYGIRKPLFEKEGQGEIYSMDFSYRTLATTIIYLFLLLAAGPDVARSATAPAQGSSNFEQEWSKLIEAGKQEGTLSIASGGAPSRGAREALSDR